MGAPGLTPAEPASMTPIISVNDVSKTYATGFRALDHVSLDVRQGEIFAVLGPKGAGKTTLIGLICGIAKITTSSGRLSART
jgi:ABC-2 type transport system ATP-binding protein